VVAEASGAQEALQLAMTCTIDVTVMDLSLPDGDGIEATEQILRRYPHIRVVGLTWHRDRSYLERMLKVGATGYVLKNNLTETLLTAIRAVAAGETYIDPRFSATDRAQQTEHGGTTPREAIRAARTTTGELSADELGVLQRVAWGYANSEIANQLGMAATTIAEHKAHAMRKLDLSTRIDVLRYAEAQGWKR
jgi:DNA-binding NarL/FixJ family response regulator